MRIELLKPYERGYGKTPVYPYGPKDGKRFEAEGLWWILQEDDVPDVIEDQVLRLGSSIDHDSLVPYYRFPWLLNSAHHKTTHSLLHVPASPLDASHGSSQTTFRSEIIVLPFDPVSDLISDAKTVGDLAIHFFDLWQMLAAPSQSAVVIAPLMMHFGQPPADPIPGFGVEIKIDGFGEDKAEAVRSWKAAISAMIPLLDS